VVPPENEGDELDVSIIIPTHNRPAALERCLAALEEQDFSRDLFEIIVVDDGSQVPAAQVSARFESVMRLSTVRQAQAGPANARNAGAAKARGQLLVFTDDDCAPQSNWLSTIVRAASDHPNTMIGGRTLNALVQNPYSTASQLLIDYLYDCFFCAGSSSDEHMFTSNNLAVPAAVFETVGGFPKEFPLPAAEDREFCDRWQHRGYALHYEPDAPVNHHHTLDGPSFWRQHFNYGREAYHFQSRRRLRGRERKIEPLTFYVNLVLYPFKIQPFGTALTTSLLLCISQIANAAGFFWQKWESR